MTDFSLRPMEPTDGPAINDLMRNEARTTSMAISTRYSVDLYEALIVQHPTTFGVVATMPGTDGLVGVATAYIDEVDATGQAYPAAHLENLKVRHDVCRQGLGGRLAEWRIAEARRRFGSDGIITTGIDASNVGSLATARRWSTQLLGPIRVVIAGVSRKPPRDAAIRVRPLEDAEIPAVVDGVNAFYRDYDLYPRQTPGSLAAMLGQTSLGGPIRRYRVAVAGDGSIVAGAAVAERFQLMTDHIDHAPRALELLSAIVPVIPRDRTIRTIELAFAWHAPGQAAAGRALWEAIRYEWRDRATHVAGQADPRGSLIEMFHVGFSMIPRVDVMVPVQSPVFLDESRPVYLWR